MTETQTQNATETKPAKGKTPKKAAKAKTAAPKSKPKPEKKPKAPRESREGWGTFALRLPIPERDAFHAAAGPSAASRVARTVLVAFANEDEPAFKAALAEARKLRA
jgi:hypothetical protein